MAILDIQIGDIPILRQKAVPVDKIDEEVLTLIDDMFETMYAAEGLGLAAPQIGVSRRIIVIDIEEYYPEYPPIALVNPVLTETDGEQIGEEGCLSLPGVRGIVRRAIDANVVGILPNGEKKEFISSDLMTRVLQHEIDHLDGILFTDRLIPEDQVLLEEIDEPSFHGNE